MYEYKIKSNAIIKRMKDFAEHCMNDIDMTKYNYSFSVNGDVLVLRSYRKEVTNMDDFEASIDTVKYWIY